MSPKTITSKRHSKSHSKSHSKTNNNNQAFRNKIKEKNLEYCKFINRGITIASPAVCIKKMNDCYLNKCFTESKNKDIATLTDQDREICDKESNGDFKKLSKCQMKILQKTNFNEHLAKLNHCEANKCFDMKTYIDKIQDTIFTKMENNIKKKQTDDQKAKLEQYNQCIQKHCKKENYDPDKLSKNFNTKQLQCHSRYNTFKKQKKCTKKHDNITNKLVGKYNKCSNKYCSQK